MRNRYLYQPLIIILLLFSPLDSIAQKIINVRSELADEKIHIYYDLLGIAADKMVNITVFISTDGGVSYGEPIKSVTGDVGPVTGPGENKCIIWNIFNDLPGLWSENVKFKVRADLLESDIYLHAPGRTIKLDISTNLGSKTAFKTGSFGLNIKGVVYSRQLGLGLRGDYTKTFRKPIDYSYSGNVLPDTGFYWGYSAGAIIEYDLIRDNKYSLYPYLYIGSSKIIYKYNQEFKQDDYFKYSVFGGPGIGFDINIKKFLYFGVELEYLISPWIDIVPSAEPDEALDGINIGFVVKYIINPGL